LTPTKIFAQGSSFPHELKMHHSAKEGNSMSVPYLREAAANDDLDKLVRFVRLHLGDGNEAVGRDEIDRSWAQATKILLRYEPVDREFISNVLEKEESTLALLFYHLHFYLIRKSGRWIHDGSR
jgi:hypothetical protein